MDHSLVFFGSGPVAAASLEHLAKEFAIEAVITKPVTQSEMTRIVPHTVVHTVSSKAELTDLIQAQDFKSKVGVIVDFGIIVESAVIKAFPLGIINSHFSLLPEWRGADPITFSILSGQPKTGVSLMLIEPTLDTGKLLTQKVLPIATTDTTATLTEKLVNLSNQLLSDFIPLYLKGEIKPHAQPHTDRATYSRKLTKEDGQLDWNKSAEMLAREIRAYATWPKSYTDIAGKPVIITQAHAVKNSLSPGEVTVVDKKLLIGCKDGSLELDKLKPAGKGEMTAQSFLAGYGQRLKN